MGAAFDEVCEVVRASMDETHTPGVAVGLFLGDEEDVAGFGVTSVENPLEVTPDTLFQIGSWDPLESTCRHASLSIL